MTHTGFQKFSNAQIRKAIEAVEAARQGVRLNACVLDKIGKNLFGLRHSGMSREVLIGIVVTDVLRPVQHGRNKHKDYTPDLPLIGAYVAATTNIVDHLDKPVRAHSDHRHAIRPHQYLSTHSTA